MNAIRVAARMATERWRGIFRPPGGRILSGGLQKEVDEIGRGGILVLVNGGHHGTDDTSNRWHELRALRIPCAEGSLPAGGGPCGSGGDRIGAGDLRPRTRGDAAHPGGRGGRGLRGASGHRGGRMSAADWIVVAAGVAAIAWVIWYFFLAERQAATAAVGSAGVQEVTITVHGGYEPAEVRLRKGIPARLVFDRQEAATQKITIPVSGMTCAACQAGVQKALQRTPGVADASVNLMMANASVTYDPSVTSPEALVEKIRDVGYGADLPRPERTAFAEQEERDRAQQEEYRELRRKAIVSGALGAVAMLVSMPLMVAGANQVHGGPVADPFMRWAMESMSPALERVFPWLYAISPAILSWTLLVLTAGVMAWAGRHFYSRAWIGFRHHAADMNTLIAVGTGSAFLYSLVATAAPGLFVRNGLAPDVYYEAVIIIIALI